MYLIAKKKPHNQNTTLVHVHVSETQLDTLLRRMQTFKNQKPWIYGKYMLLIFYSAELCLSWLHVLVET